MPEAPQVSIEGGPVLDTIIRALTEGIAGNGVLAPGDLEVTAGSSSLDIDVSAGDAYLSGSQYSYGGGTSVAILNSGDATYDRWDTVAFDTGTTSIVVHEGTAEQYPTAPDIQSGEIALAIIYVAANATAISDADITNIRTGFSNEAEQIHYDDGSGAYGVDNLDDALDELQEAAQAGSYPLALADLASPFSLPSITDMDAAGNDFVDSGTTVWDTSATEVPQGQLGGPASSLSAYPLANSDLSNSTVTVTAGQNLSGGGSVGLGGSTTVDYAPGELGLPTHHVEYEGGLTDEEIARLQIPSGRQLEVYQLDVELKGGGSDTSVVLDIYDATNSTEIASTSAGTLTSGSPLGTSGDGATVLARLETGSSGPYTITTSGVVNIGDI